MKVQIEMDEEFVSRIDAYAKQQGINRSTFVKVCVGEKIMTLDKTFGMLEGIGEKLSTMTKDEK